MGQAKPTARLAVAAGALVVPKFLFWTAARGIELPNPERTHTLTRFLLSCAGDIRERVVWFSDFFGLDRRRKPCDYLV